MTHGTFSRVTLDLRAEAVLPLPRLSQGGTQDNLLASLLRELFTQPGGGLEACAGAVLLDEDDRARALTAPFGEEWPQAAVQGPELFTTARKAGWRRLVLFRVDPNPHSVPDITLQFAQEMRALGLLFAVEVVDLLIVRPRRHWTLSKVPLLPASLHCEATLSRTFDRLIVGAFERWLPPLEIGESTESGLVLRAKQLLEIFRARMEGE